MSKLAEKMLTAMEIISSAQIANTTKDETIRGTIVRVAEDGFYDVQCDGNLYSNVQGAKGYEKDEVVFVLCPEGRDSLKEKLIISKYYTPTEQQEQVIDDSNEYIDVGENVIQENGFNNGLFKDFLQRTGAFRLSFKVKTNLSAFFGTDNMENLNYGIKVTLNFGANDDRVYTLDINDMIGVPYAYTDPQPQTKVFNIADPENLVEITAVEPFIEGYDLVSGESIEYSDITLIPTIEESKIDRQQIWIHNSSPDLELDLTTNGDSIKLAAYPVSKDGHNASFSWELSNENGWRGSVASGSSFTIDKGSHIYATNNAVKCTANFSDNETVEKIIDFTAITGYEVTITTTVGESNVEKTLTAEVTGITNVTYKWSSVSLAGKKTDYDDTTGKTLAVDTSQIDLQETYTCKVYVDAMYLGEDSVTLSQEIRLSQLDLTNELELVSTDDNGIPLPYIPYSRQVSGGTSFPNSSGYVEWGNPFTVVNSFYGSEEDEITQVKANITNVTWTYGDIQNDPIALDTFALQIIKTTVDVNKNRIIFECELTPIDEKWTDLDDGTYGVSVEIGYTVVPKTRKQIAQTKAEVYIGGAVAAKSVQLVVPQDFQDADQKLDARYGTYDENNVLTLIDLPISNADSWDFIFKYGELSTKFRVEKKVSNVDYSLKLSQNGVNITNAPEGTITFTILKVVAGAEPQTVIADGTKIKVTSDAPESEIAIAGDEITYKKDNINPVTFKLEVDDFTWDIETLTFTQDGVGFAGITELYYATKSGEPTNKPVIQENGILNYNGWVTTVAETGYSIDTPYLWNIEYVQKTDGNNYLTEMEQSSVYGQNGEDGREEIDRISYYSITNDPGSQPISSIIINTTTDTLTIPNDWTNIWSEELTTPGKAVWEIECIKYNKKGTTTSQWKIGPKQLLTYVAVDGAPESGVSLTADGYVFGQSKDANGNIAYTPSVIHVERNVFGDAENVTSWKWQYSYTGTDNSWTDVESTDSNDKIYTAGENDDLYVKSTMVSDSNPSIFIKIIANGDTKYTDGLNLILAPMGTDGKDGKDAIAFVWNNPVLVFNAPETGVVAQGQSETASLIVLKGGEDISSKISLSLMPTSTIPTGITLTKSKNIITLTVTGNNGANFGSNTNINGSIAFSFTYDGKTYNPVINWTKITKGDKGDKGDDAITLALDNDSDTIARTNAGVIIGTSPYSTAKVSAYKGGNAITNATITLTSSPTGMTRGTHFSYANNILKITAIPTAFTQGEFKFTYNNIEKIFTLKVIASNVDYDLICSQTVVNNTGVTDDANQSVTFSVLRKETSTSTLTKPSDDTSIQLEVSTNEGESWSELTTLWSKQYNSTSTNYKVRIVSSDGKIVWDEETIEFVQNGNGISTTTKDYAADSQGTNPPSGEWKPTIAETGITAGQYLWTKITTTYTKSTKPDITYNVSYWGNNGTSPYRIELSNDSGIVVTDKDGNNGSYGGDNVKTTVSLYEGDEDISTKTTWKISKDNAVSGTAVNNNRTYTITGLSQDSGTVTFSTTWNKISFSKTFKVSKLKQGQTGDHATAYWLESSLGAIAKNVDNSYKDTSITFTAKSQTGISVPSIYKTKMAAFIDNSSTSSSTSTNGTITITLNDKKPLKNIKCIMYYGTEDSAPVLDEELVPVISDGTSVSIKSITYGVSAAPTSEPKNWVTDIKEAPTSAANPYLWTKIEYSDGNEEKLYELHNHETVVYLYKASATANGVTAPTFTSINTLSDDWSATEPDYNSNKPYLFRTQQTSINNTFDANGWSEPVIIKEKNELISADRSTFLILTSEAKELGVFSKKTDKNKIDYLAINASYIQTGNLKVENNGQTLLSATLGGDNLTPSVEIGGFTVAGTGKNEGYIAKNKKEINDDDINGIYLGTDGIATGAGAFKAKADGDVELKGSITAGSTITGSTIIGSTFQNKDETFKVDANGNIKGATITGSTFQNKNGNFKVEANGNITGANITGSTFQSKNGNFSVNSQGYVNSISGQIGGWTLSKTGFVNTDNSAYISSAAQSASESNFLPTLAIGNTYTARDSIIYTLPKSNGFIGRKPDSSDYMRQDYVISWDGYSIDDAFIVTTLIPNVTIKKIIDRNFTTLYYVDNLELRSIQVALTINEATDNDSGIRVEVAQQLDFESDGQTAWHIYNSIQSGQAYFLGTGVVSTNNIEDYGFLVDQTGKVKMQGGIEFPKEISIANLTSKDIKTSSLSSGYLYAPKITIGNIVIQPHYSAKKTITRTYEISVYNRDVYIDQTSGPISNENKTFTIYYEYQPSSLNHFNGQQYKEDFTLAAGSKRVYKTLGVNGSKIKNVSFNPTINSDGTTNSPVTTKEGSVTIESQQNGLWLGGAYWIDTEYGVIKSATQE